MNARLGVYPAVSGNPVVGRFLSPDNYISDPSNTQSYNRYSYCLNNPLKYIDPSGQRLEKWYDWFNPMNYFIEGMQFINDNTVGLRRSMVDAGIPAFNVDVSIGSDGYVTTPGLEAYKTSKGLMAQSAKYDRELNGWRNAAANGGGKNLLDQGNYLAALKAAGATAYFSARLNRWSMYKPLESSLVSYRGAGKYMSAFKGVNAAKGVGFGLTGIGIGYDLLIGVPRYQRGIRDEWSVSPQKAGLNTGVALYSLSINPAVGVLYFGIDAFYPGGLGGYMNDTDRIIQRNQQILGPGWNMYRMEGGLK
jgi:hypothetical protein